MNISGSEIYPQVTSSSVSTKKRWHGAQVCHAVLGGLEDCENSIRYLNAIICSIMLLYMILNFCLREQ